MYHVLRAKITLGLFFFASAAGAQVMNNEDHDFRPIHFGINIGYNQSHYNFLHSTQFLKQDSIMVIESLNSSGLNMAGLVNINISRYFDIRAYPLDLVFTEKAFQYRLSHPDIINFEDSVMLKKVQGITMAFPLQLKFSSDRIHNFKVFMMAGGRVDYDMSANKFNKTNQLLLKISPWDYSVEGGIGFHIYFPVFVLTPELKITEGLHNVHMRDPTLKFSNTIDKINARTIAFSLTVE